ncbi:hypothetical protein JJB11_11980 [Ramlibacter ginsenosidimutans]|uniref:Uncharacterized protein n=1 Tax=Ramlibacter ginsenosidimutans TaxID=502333 RepID=A0A934TTN4_9BURK|nr:hypothetical protein [Ramlibacter ginsenosidimutans]MBK6006811.1 hypothetical protein [Ramlibacter ginsenosidimutans]
MIKPSISQDFPDTQPITVPMEFEASLDAPTEPMGLMDMPAYGGLELAPIEVTLYEVTGLTRKDNRVCPQPSRWLEMYRILQDQPGRDGLPPDPVVGSAWASTPPLAKRMAFHEQLEWADRNHCLTPVHEYLKTLRDVDWYVA